MISTFYPDRVLRPRVTGALVGFGVATILMVISAISDEMSAGSPTLPTVLAPTILAGTLGGALVGPRTSDPAWYATRARRFRLRLRLAVVAIFIGAPIVALEIGVDGLLRGYGNGVLDLAASVLVLSPVGILFVGPFVMPITYAAALVWSWIMRRFIP